MAFSQGSDDGAPVYEVVIAKYGTRVASRSEVYLNYHLYGQPDAPIEMDYFVWIVRNRSSTIVVDTGFSPEGGRARGRQSLVELPDLWASLGVLPEDAPLVAITHGHYDHAGNLAHFPTSRIAMARPEIDFVTGPHLKRTLFHHSFEDSDVRDILAARQDGRLDLFDGELELAPGVRMLNIGGHTPGQSIVLVPTSVGTVLLASDSLHYQEELTQDMPFTSVADVVQMYAGFDRINEMTATGLVDHVVAGHDPGTLDQFALVGRRTSELTVVLGELERTS